MVLGVLPWGGHALKGVMVPRVSQFDSGFAAEGSGGAQQAVHNHDNSFSVDVFTNSIAFAGRAFFEERGNKCSTLPCFAGRAPSLGGRRYIPKASLSSSAFSTIQAAPWRARKLLFRKPHVTEMQARPAFFAVSMSTSESPM